jgi:hypothetical protein
MNILDAAYNVVHDYPGGSQSLAPRMGKSATTLSHEVAAIGTAKLGLLDAAKITHLTNDLRILAAFAANAGQMLVPLPNAAPMSDDCMLRLADTAKEFGELCREVAGDLVDGEISDNELGRIDRACGELIASVHAMREALARRNAAAKPDHIRAVA